MGLRTISQEELKEILEQHKLWLETRFCDAVKGKQADLSYANLYNANLDNANLEYAHLEYANLEYANLYNANLYNANLEYAHLEYANLEYAHLDHANLDNANLEYAHLYNANLYNANLEYAHLEYANLEYAHLDNANLDNANLDENEQIRKGYILKDDFIAYKKCRENLIVKLCIPKGSIVFSINNGKCRTNRAKVLDITNISLKKHFKEAISMWSDKFVYKVGDELEIDDFNLMYNVECGSGIHFFRTLEEAKQYRG